MSGAIRALPHELRKACAEERAHCRAIGARYEVDLTCGLIGLCEGEMREVVFAEVANFEPRDASAWFSPDVGGLLPTTAQDVLAVAQRQLRFVEPDTTRARRERRSRFSASARTGSPQGRSRC